MKILICDYKVDLERDVDYEIQKLKKALPNAEVELYEYQDDKEELIFHIQDADAVINTYVALDRDILSHCGKLKCIALNAVGYNMVDIPAATEFGIPVCPAAEYCTAEVAEHTLALILALTRGIRPFIRDIENRVWNYMDAGPIQRLSGQCLTVFGFGKIGKAVALRAQALGLRVQAVSGSLKDETAKELGIERVDWKTAMETSDILCNHMALNEKTADFFDLEKFRRAAEKKPLFINTGRGGTVVQEDLVLALDKGYLRGAGLDVLESENVDFDHLKLLGRDNVIITPHAGFYSVQAARDLQDISCDSVIAALNGRYSDISKIVNRAEMSL